MSGSPHGGGVPASPTTGATPCAALPSTPSTETGPPSPRAHAATAALERWKPEPALAASNLDELVARVWAASKADANATLAALAALAARASTDATAARVLLQTLRPGLRTLGRRLALGSSFDNVDHDLLALAWEQIRTYPIDRRPSAIAANILLDIRKRYVQNVIAETSASLADLSDDRTPTSPSAEHETPSTAAPSPAPAPPSTGEPASNKTTTP